MSICLDGVSTSSLGSCHWDNYGNALVLKKVRLQDGKIYDITIERDGEQIPGDFAMSEDDLREMQKICRDNIFSKVPSPSEYAIEHNSRDNSCFVQSLRSHQVQDLTHDFDMAYGFRRINALLSPQFRSMSSSSAFSMIPADTSVRKPAPRLDATPIVDEEKSHLEEDPLEVDDSEEEEAVSTDPTPTIPTPFPQTNLPTPASAPTGLSDRSVNVVSDESESDDEAGFHTPAGRMTPAPQEVPSSSVNQGEIEQNLARILDQKVKPENSFTTFRNYVETRNASPRQSHVLDGHYDSLIRLLKDPKSNSAADGHVKMWLRQLIQAAYDDYFTRIQEGLVSQELSPEQARGDLAARWVIALLAKGAKENIELLVRELNPANLVAEADASNVKTTVTAKSEPQKSFFRSLWPF